VPGFGGFGARMKKGRDEILFSSFYDITAKLEVGLYLGSEYI
jgi:hypothetical protein